MGRRGCQQRGWTSPKTSCSPLLFIPKVQDFPPSCAEKWSRDYLHLTIGDLLRLRPPQEGETDSKMLAGKQWLVEVPGALWRTGPVSRSEDPSWQERDLSHKTLAPRNEVDYSKVVAVPNSLNPEQSSPFDSQVLSKDQGPADGHPGDESGQGVFWLQNVTYKALMDGGLRKKTTELPTHFPFLGSFVSLKEDLYLSEHPRGVPIEKS